MKLRLLATLTLSSLLASAALSAADNNSPSPTLTVLHTFTREADGAVPYAGVTLDPAGNVYGTASAGGSFNNNTCAGLGGCGVVFKIDTHQRESVLYAFQGGIDGAQPYAGVTRDSSGVLYGAPYAGGTYGLSDVFKVQSSRLCRWAEQFSSKMSEVAPSSSALFSN